MKKKKEQFKESSMPTDVRFDYMMQGLSFDQAQDEYDSQKEQVQDYKEPTQKDILQDWIISKDYEQQEQELQPQYKYGGKKFQGYQDSQLDLPYYSRQNGINPDLSIGDYPTVDELRQDARQYVEDVRDFVGSPIYFPERQVGNGLKQSSINVDALDPRLSKFNAEENWNYVKQNSNGMGLALANTALNAIGNYNDIKSRYNERQADVNRVGSYNVNFLSTNQALNQMSNRPTFDYTTKYDMGAKTAGQMLGNAALAAASTPGGWITRAVAATRQLGSDLFGNYKTGLFSNKTNNAYAIADNQNDAKDTWQVSQMNQDKKLTQMRGINSKHGGKIHTKASGGYINSNSSNFPDKLTEFNVGGNHEDNPNGGIQQGINPNDGQPNLVEQDETKYNDYIFSKRIYADGGSLKANMLDKKYENWVYADISKDLYKNYKERPNDAISRRTFEDAMQKLQNAQEATKLKLKQKKVGGFLNALDNEQISALTDQMMIEHEQRAQMEEQAEQEAMLGQEYSKGGHVYQNKGFMNVPVADNTYYKNRIIDPILQEQFAQALEKEKYESLAQGIPFVRADYNGDTNTWGDPVTYDVYFPDGTVGKTGLVTGIAPAPSRTGNPNPAKIGKWGSQAKKANDMVRNVKNTERAIVQGRTTAKAFAKAGKETESAAATSNKMVQNLQEAKWLGNVDETMNSRSLPQGLTYSRPEPVVFDYRYGTDPVLNQGPDFFGDAAKWIQNAKAREAGLVGGILGGAGVLGTAAALLDRYNQDASGQNPNNAYYTSDVKDALQGYGPLFDIEGSHGRVFDAGMDDNKINVFPWPQSYYPEDLDSGETQKTNERYKNWKIKTKDGKILPKEDGSKNRTPVSDQETSNTGSSSGTGRPTLNGGIGNNVPKVPSNPNVLIKPGGGSSLFTTYGKFGTGKPNSTTEEKPETATETTGESNTGNTNGNNGNGNGNIDYNTLLRFSPVIGSGINYVRDKLGLQNYNDYTDADMYQRQIDDIAPIYAPLIGGYQEYTPIDQEYLRNQTNAQAAAQMRAIANASNGNRGYVSVNNAVNRYDLLNDIGALGIAAAQQDMKDRLAVAEFNNKIDQINQSADLNVAEKNQAIQAEKARLYSKLAEMRTAERYANDAARAGNENAFFANLGAIGKEATALKLANSNLGMYYGIDPVTMDLYYKPAFYRLSKDKQKEVVDSADKMGIKVE